MPNEFIARNGLIALNNTTITGSFRVGAFTSSFAGPVGIGTSSPSTSLDVSGNGRIAGIIITGNPAIPTGTGAALTEGYYAGGGYAFFQGYNYTTNAYIPVYVDGQRLVLNANSSGNVLINTTSDAGYKLDVNGTTRFNGNSQITGSLNVNGTSATIKATGNSYGGTSFVNGTWGYAKVGILGEPTIAMISNVQGSAQSLEGITIPATSSALLFSSGYGYNVGNNYQIISVGTLGVRVGNTTQALTIPTSGIVTVNQGLIITGSLNITGSITTTGTITAQTLVVQTITSSTDFVTGSTRFGSLLANTHQFTGSVSMTGSLTTVGTASFNGPVGVGTTTPSSSLEINKNVSYTEIIGSANNPAIRIKNTNSANFNEKAEVQFTIGNSVLPTAAISNLYTSFTAGTQQGGDLVFSTRVAGSTLDERMRILYNGNVGIGTTSPSNLFEVNGISAVVTPYGAFTALQASGSTGYRWTLANDASFRLQYTTNGFSGLAGTPLYVSSSGNIGIGTTTPSFKLDVSGSDALFNDVRVGRGAGNIATNTLVGSGSLANNTTGNNNTAVGVSALALIATGSYSTAVGSNALTKATRGANTALGYSAGSEMTTGAGNTVIGAGNNVKPDNATLTTQTGILSISSADQPEIWGQLVQVEVAPTGSATILSIDAQVYAGAVVDYSLQDNAGAQRTSTMLIAFDTSANLNYTDPNPIEVGAGLGDYTFIPITNGTVDLNLTNNSGTQYCVIVLSCRLLKRYF